MATDWVWAIWKRGDQETALGNEHIGIKHLMLVCWIDPELDNQTDMSQWMQKVYLCTKVKRALVPTLSLGCLSNQEKEDDAIDPKTYVPRQRTIDIDAVAISTSLSTLAADAMTDKTISVVDATAMGEKLVKVAKPTVQSVRDIMAITAGAYGVGSGDDYATWAAFFADWGNLTAALSAEQSSSLTETAGSAIGENFGGYDVELTSASTPAGVPTAGYLTSINANVRFYHESGSSGNHDTTIDGIYLKPIAANTLPLIQVQSTSGTVGVCVCDCMCDHNGKASRFYQNQVTATHPQILNCEVWGSTSSTPMIYIYNKGTVGDNIIENCTVYDNGNAEGIDAGTRAITIRNCACFGNSVDFAQIGSATGYNNAASDATNANGNWSTSADNLESQSAAACFLSTTDTNSDFLNLDPTGNLARAGYGTLLSDNTSGIRGNARPRLPGSTVSIGAAEEVSGGMIAPRTIFALGAF